MARAVVQVIHAMLDGTAALIHIATLMEANVVPMEATVRKGISVSIVTLSTQSVTTVPTAIPSSITQNPEPSITLRPIPVYEYYYFTVTWYYWSYYYYYYTINIDLRTSTRSTHITTTTKFSVYETNSAAASSSFKQLSATFSFPTPAAATLPIKTPPSTPTQTPSSESDSTSHSTSHSTDTNLRVGGTDEPTSLSSFFSTASTRSIASGSSSSLTATSSPISVTVSGAAGIQKEGYLWPLVGLTIFSALGAALWLL
ncbi:hypothetical protein EYC80_000359 [Monilinia laxa]|uniref:Uncharacterized protein n=1 Tax=Monilinia laxa TaxID=61186 RepID=A0A5N6KBI1_MONLA|nr:hypothetical protein EYC80_000359 [Monilinia laxa]